MFKEFDVVKLTRDHSSQGLKAGAAGTILFANQDPELYEVEFIFSDNHSVVLTLEVRDLALWSS